MPPPEISNPDITPSPLMIGDFSHQQYNSIYYLIATAISQALVFYVGSKCVSLRALSVSQGDGDG
jgi:hypothetical protein